MTAVQAPERRPTRRRVDPDARDTYVSRGAAAVAVAPAPSPGPRPRPEARPDHLRVVAPSERARRGLTPARAVLLTALLFATLFAVAVAHTMLVQGQVKLDRIDAELAVEQARYQQLRKDVAELESPARIVEAAHQQGMVTPDDLVYLQPAAPDPSAVGPTTGDDHEPGADPTVGVDPDSTWPMMKPLLEAPAP
jgi:cell division protein FtsL